MEAEQILKALKRQYPGSKYYLNFSNPLELLVAAILSAQCRDDVVNRATKGLFAKYKTADDYSVLDDSDIKTISFFKTKARRIRASAKMLAAKYGGEVPKSSDELSQLPGIGRKTANAILQNAFGIMDGVITDTHVVRVSNRLGWAKGKNPEQTEKDLMNLFPKKYWKEIPHLMKSHGKAVCKAPNPLCDECVLRKVCPRIGVAVTVK